jgi:hypothetical protein
MFCAKLKVELDVLIPGMKHWYFFAREEWSIDWGHINSFYSRRISWHDKLS